MYSCQKPCPYNENISYSPIRELHPFDFMNSDNTEELSVIGNGKFKESYLQTSCGWRGKNVLKRNAIIRLSRDKDISKIKTDSPYLKEYINRLLKNNEI